MRNIDHRFNIFFSIMEETVLGIDLGTTNCCVSVWKGRRSEIILDEFGNKTIPSVVAFYKSLKLVGKDAKNMIDIIPENTFYDVKRIIGLDYESIKDIKYFTYKIKKGDNGEVIVSLTESENLNKDIKMDYYPEEISAMLLSKIKIMAQNYLKKKISKAVITIPAYYGDAQRQATKNAATIAGLEVVALINEPTAAALAYGITTGKSKKKNILVYDLGGGTLDVSLLNIEDDVFRVLATSGDIHLGGEDFDHRIMEYVLQGKKINSISHQMLKKACETAKKILTTNDFANITFEEFNIKISREIFEKECEELFNRCLTPIIDVLKKADVNVGEVSDVILVGGSTRMPRIKRILKEYFGEEVIRDNVNPDEVVSIGASIHGYSLVNNTTSFSDGIILLDIVPLSLGIETLNGIMTPILPRGSILPSKKHSIFTTTEDNQTNLTIKIYEGERKLTKDNYLIGIFELKNIKPAPRGTHTIKITFDIDTNGMLFVSVHDKQSSQSNNIIINSLRSSKGKMSDEQIQKLLDEANKMESVDMENYKKISYVNELSNIASILSKNNKEESENIVEWIKNDHELEEIKNKLDIVKGKYIMLLTSEKKDEFIQEEEELKMDEEKMIKDTLLDLCDSVKKNNKESFVTDYIEVVYLWIYSNPLLSYNEYVDKITEIENFRSNIPFRRLEQLCIDLKTNINDLNISEKDLDILEDVLIETLTWLSDNTTEKESIYNNKFDEINNLCNSFNLLS